MSKELKKHEARLEREARLTAALIRRAIQQYNESVENGAHFDARYRIEKQQEIDRVVGEYIELHRSLKRLRKKLRS